MQKSTYVLCVCPTINTGDWCRYTKFTANLCPQQEVVHQALGRMKQAACPASKLRRGAAKAAARAASVESQKPAGRLLALPMQLVCGCIAGPEGDFECFRQRWRRQRQQEISHAILQASQRYDVPCCARILQSRHLSLYFYISTQDKLTHSRKPRKSPAPECKLSAMHWCTPISNVFYFANKGGFSKPGPLLKTHFSRGQPFEPLAVEGLTIPRNRVSSVSYKSYCMQRNSPWFQNTAPGRDMFWPSGASGS